MNAKLSVLAVAAGLVLATVPAWAHHSFAAEFDINQAITLKGTLTKMEWINPHGWLYLDVKNADGTVTNWAVEAVAPNALLRRGLRKTDFPAGTEVIIEGYRAKTGAAANGITVKMTDGRNFFLGSSGSGAPEPPGRQ